MSEEMVACPLCRSEVENTQFNFHLQAEECVLEMIAQRHPDWKEADGSCNKCMEYYMKMGEAQPMS